MALSPAWSSLLLLVFLSWVSPVQSEPATLRFTDCFDANNGNSSNKIDINTVYAQALTDADDHPYLNLTVLANSPADILGYANDTKSNLATLFTSTSVLTLNVFSDSRYWCESLQPQSPLPDVNPPDDSTSAVDPRFCPLSAGPFAFSANVPWGNGRALTTLHTRLRAVDPFSQELLCLDVQTTPLDPHKHSPYGIASIIFWASVGLSIAFWALVGLARIVSAWGRGRNHSSGAGVWAHARSAGYILASAISGERLATSPALMRFCTPSMRDIIFHTQWCSALAMIAVQWPTFIYPLLDQTSWAMLTYNISLTDGAMSRHWNPLQPATPYSPPSAFEDQLGDSNNPIYLDRDAPNTLFMLPANASSGMDKFAYAAGVNPKDLFSICMALFLAIMAATIVLSILVWLIDYFAHFVQTALGRGAAGSNVAFRGPTRSPAFNSSKDMLDNMATSQNALEESKSLNGHGTMRPSSRLTMSGGNAVTTRKAWWKSVRTDGAFHGSVLHGNLVRILVLFHLPITIFSAFQMTMSRDVAPLSSVILAGLSFAVFSVILPAILVVRLHFTSTNKLYDETRTLLSLGPLYNHYRHGSQMFAALLFATNVVFGVVIGAGQQSGTAQAIVILVVEVVSALVTSLWLPWGTGASMGLISFLFCVARIVVAVLVVILTPAISIDAGAGGWVAYGILVIMGLIFVAHLLMLIVKLVEALVRVFGGVGFDRSRHAVDSGLLGACGMLGCCGGRKRRKSRRAKERKGGRGRDSVASSSVVGLPTHRGKRSSFQSTTTGGGGGAAVVGPPPSVLRPEHALRPYKEDVESDDDENSGFIMGAWQPFQKQQQQAGYIPVSGSASQLPPKQQQQPSGFSRVGGGRANMDSPYAINAAVVAAQSGAGGSGSTHTFPTLTSPTPLLGGSASMSRIHDIGDDISVSSTNAARQHQLQQQQQQYQNQYQHQHQATSSSSSGGLPPGAMAPYHVRTKSQTAIIENALDSSNGAGGNNSRPGSRANNLSNIAGSANPPSAYGYRHSAAMSEDESASSNDGGGKKRKPWFILRRNRPHSSDGYSGPPSAFGMDEEQALGSAGSGKEKDKEQPAGKSFVVVRKGQQAPASAAGAGLSGAGNRRSRSTTPTPTQATFSGI